MKQEAGWGATILVAIAAVFGISSFQTKAPLEGSTSKKGAEQVTASARPSKKQFSEGGCAELESRLQNFLMVDPDEVAAPKSCYPDGKGPKTAAEIRARSKDLRFVIATLPDPVYTHFPLLFDRSAEAIQQAAQDEHYVYDSSWLPWDTEEISFTRIDDRDEAEKRKKHQEDQPGILLFRAQPDPLHPDIRQPFTHGLVVFIVGEEPTGGIHRRQFENAAGWIEALRPAYPAKSVDAIQIMGPTFSGSLPSLAKLLNEKSIANTLLPSGKGTLNIFSGNITNDCAVAWFSAVRYDRKDFAVAFHSFQQSDSVATSQYGDYLRAAGVTDLARLAIVSEDETAFGAQHQEPSSSSNEIVKRSPGPCDIDKNLRNATYLYYPRDISALRAAYQSQSIFDRNAAKSPSDTARRELQTDLSDTGGRQHDTIRSYSGNQMALSQEAQLQQIISMLRAHQSQYILLRSSNPLDQIFLGRFLRQSYPEARVVIVGADSLLSRETGASGLNGIMTLSSYPLLPWEGDWTKSLDQRQVHSHRAFTQDGAEGMYVASRFLLHEPKLECLQETFLPFNWVDQFELQDYAEPFWAGGTRSRPKRPPTWLSVLGNGGFWPVAAISDVMTTNQDPPMEKENKHRIVDVFSAISQTVASTWKSLPHALGFTTSDVCKEESDECWLDLPLSMRLCLLGILIWAIFHTFCCAAPSVTVKPSHRAHFVRTMGLSHSVLILIGCLLVSSVPILLAWGFGALSEAGEPLPHRWPYRIILPLVWLISLFALCANIWVERRLSKTARQGDTWGLGWNPRRVFELVWEPVTFLALSFAFYWILEVSLEGALNATNRVPTYWRSMNLTTGVSPLVPLIALVIGLYGWVWYSLQGLSLLAEDRPRIPKAKDLLIRRPGEVTKDDLLRILSRDWAAKPIEKRCLPFSFEAVIVAGFIFGAVLIVCQHLSGGLPIRSLGSKNYSLLFLLSLTLCISILIANAWQLSHVWLGLRQMLLFLDKLPLRRSFDALRGFSWGSIWKMSGNLLDMRYKLIYRQFESLGHLNASLLQLRRDRWGSSEYAVRTRNELDKAILETRHAGRDFTRWYSENWNKWVSRDRSRLSRVQAQLAMTAAMVLTEILVPAWREEQHSLVLDLGADGSATGKEKGELGIHPVARLEPHIQNAEELVCLVYMGFIQNVLGRMRSITIGMALLFIAIAIGVSSYPFDPRPVLSGAVIALFSILGAVVVIVYSQMHRDATLSNLTNTKPGELGADFWIKLIGLGIGPVIGLLASVFPELTDFLFSWLQPGLASMR